MLIKFIIICRVSILSVVEDNNENIDHNYEGLVDKCVNQQNYFDIVNIRNALNCIDTDESIKFHKLIKKDKTEMTTTQKDYRLSFLKFLREAWKVIPYHIPIIEYDTIKKYSDTDYDSVVNLFTIAVYRYLYFDKIIYYMNLPCQIVTKARECRLE